MKLLLVICALVAFVASAPSEEVDYLSAYDFDALFANDAQTKALFDCLLDKQPCGENQKFKDSAVKTIKNKCAECTPQQKEKYDRVLKTLHEKYETETIAFLTKVESMKN